MATIEERTQQLKDDNTVPELKKIAKGLDIDISGLTRQDQLVAAIIAREDELASEGADEGTAETANLPDPVDQQGPTDEVVPDEDEDDSDEVVPDEDDSDDEDEDDSDEDEPVSTPQPHKAPAQSPMGRNSRRYGSYPR
jgi:hypothetical protein